MTDAKIQYGSKVRTLEGSLDHRRHAGEVGIVQGFARFSSYHPHEVSVKFPSGAVAWFWLSSVVLADAEPTPSKFTTAYSDSFAA